MVQAQAHKLLNQKEQGHDTAVADEFDNPLYVATERLMVALDRLEVGLQQASLAQARDVVQHEQITHFEKENKALQLEQEALNETIIQLQDEYSDLHEVASAIYQKLEDSIKRLNQILGA